MAALKVEIELPRDLIAALNIPESDIGRRAQEWVALELFQEGGISAGKAAEILGLSKLEFLDLLNQRNLPYLDADANELEREAAAAEAASQSAQRRM
jgi:predicted HTH domain antitoxin